MYEKNELRRKIKLANVSDVHEFVKLADAGDCDVNIGYDRIIIDAKSIVGVMGLDLGRDLLVHCYGKNEKMGQFLEDHQIAGK